MQKKLSKSALIKISFYFYDVSKYTLPVRVYLFSPFSPAVIH